MGSFELSVSDRTCLTLINDFVHDQAFEITEVVHSSADGTVIVPFRLDARQVRGVKVRWRQELHFPARLQIYEVEDFELEDSYGIGRNALNVVTFDPVDRRLAVVTDVPTIFNLSVRELHVSVAADLEDDRRRIGSRVISWPILVHEHHDVMFFRSLEGVQYLEPIDVKNEEYVAYDCEGRLLELGVERVASRGWLGRHTWREQVVIDSAERDPTHVEELRKVLTHYLSHVEPSFAAESSTTSQLMERAISHGDVY